MQLKTTQLKPWRQSTLMQQGGLCALCGTEIPEGKAVADHDHRTGHLRGVIHRSCNSVLGKVERGSRYGREFNAVAFAQGLHGYLTNKQEYPIHPAHGKKRRRK